MGPNHFRTSHITFSTYIFVRAHDWNAQNVWLQTNFNPQPVTLGREQPKTTTTTTKIYRSNQHFPKP